MASVKDAIEEMIEESYLLGLSEDEIREDFRRFLLHFWLSTNPSMGYKIISETLPGLLRPPMKYVCFSRRVPLGAASHACAQRRHQAFICCVGALSAQWRLSVSSMRLVGSSTNLAPSAYA